MGEAIIPKRRIVTPKGNLIEVVAWKVPKSKFYPEGMKYSFVLVHKEKRAIAFDNFNNEGHHRHSADKKGPYAFESLEKTAVQFFMLAKKFESKQGDEHD